MATAMVTMAQLGQGYTSVPLQAPEETSSNETKQETDFLVTPPRAKKIARIAANDRYVIRSWSTILLDFLTEASEQDFATALLNEYNYEKAIFYTLECWQGRAGSTATFKECLDKLEGRHCSALVEKLLEKEENILRADSTGRVMKAIAHCVLPPSTSSSSSTGDTESATERGSTEDGLAAQARGLFCINQICKMKRQNIICGIIFTFVVLTGIVLLCTAPWKNVTHTQATIIDKTVENLTLEGKPGRYKRWDVGIREELKMVHPPSVKHLNFTYVHLGPSLNAFLAWIGQFRAFRTIHMTHVFWDEPTGFPGKIELPNLVEFMFMHDVRGVVTEKFKEAAAQYVNSIVFFYKDHRKRGLGEDSALDTFISVSTSILPSEKIILVFQFNPVNKSMLLYNMQTSPILKIVSANYELKTLTMAECSVAKSDFKALSSLRSITILKLEVTPKGDLSKIFQSMPHLESLEYVNPAEVLDLSDVVSTKLRIIQVFGSNVTLTVNSNSTPHLADLKFLHLNNVHCEENDTLQTQFKNVFYNVSTFIITTTAGATSEPTSNLTNELSIIDLPFRKSIELIAEEKATGRMARAVTTMFAIKHGRLQTSRCLPKEVCILEPCVLPTAYTTYDAEKYDDVCQKCVAGCRIVLDWQRNRNLKRALEIMSSEYSEESQKSYSKVTGEGTDGLMYRTDLIN